MCFYQTYDPIGLVTKKKLPNGVVMDATFDHRRLKQMVYKNALGAALASFSYEHDAIANITKMVDNEGSHLYSYDNQSRLVEVQYPFSFVDPNAMTGEKFKLDPSGNRLEHTITRGTRIETETASFDASDRILSSRITTLVPPGQTVELETRSFEHDANGAMVRQTVTSTPPGSVTASVATTEYVYDTRQRLVQVKLSNGQVVDQQYYPDSPLRLFFTAPGLAPVGGAKTFQVWDPETQNPLQDLDGTNGLVTDYVMGNRIDEPLGRVAGGATHAFLGDHLKSIRGLVDSAGVQTNRYTYAAFGLGRSQVEAVANRLRFTARELDLATGLQFNRNRHYLAALGRWTQRDPMEFSDGPNMYAYVGNVPTLQTDPTGTTYVIEPPSYWKPWPGDIEDELRNVERDYNEQLEYYRRRTEELQRKGLTPDQIRDILERTQGRIDSLRERLKRLRDQFRWWEKPRPPQRRRPPTNKPPKDDDLERVCR